MDLEHCVSATLDDTMRTPWREFVAGLPANHYSQDPDWALVLAGSSSPRPRQPLYSWSTRDGRPVLVAAGYRQESPRPGVAYYDFGRGPAFSDLEVFADWLRHIREALGHDAVYIRVAPYHRLDADGADVEALLAREGFTRDTNCGTWATLLVDITPEPDALFGSFQRQARQQVGKCDRACFVVHERDDLEGWEAFCALHAELARRAKLGPIQLQDVASLHEHWLKDLGGTVLVGFHESRPAVAALVLKHGPVAYYLISAARRDAGGIAPGFCLPWNAMLFAKRHGCTTLDLCGYSLTAQPGDPLHGINRFKRSFAPRNEPVQYCAQHDLLLRPRTFTAISAARRMKDWVRDHRYQPPQKSD